MFNPNSTPNGSDLGWSAFGFGSFGSPPQTLTQLNSPLSTAPVTTQTAAQAYQQVVDRVGNFWWARDAIDARIINNVRNNTGPPGGIGTAAPSAAELASVTGAPMTSRAAGWDSDNDGMPDSWEIAHGLNPNSAADSKLDFDSDGYVNVVEYLNEVGEIPAPAPIVFHGATNNRYAQITNWRTDDGGITAGSNWQPGRYDIAMIHNGTVVVDAVGQRADILEVGPNSGDSAALNITAGSLEVVSGMGIGVFNGTGVVNQSGGSVRTYSVALGGLSGVYNLSGGVLRVVDFNRRASGHFNFTGGVLSADIVDFDLVNNGGTIAPGQSIGQTYVADNLMLDSNSTLEIEIGGNNPFQYDKVVVGHTADLGGTLRVKLVDLGGGSYVPQLGDSFDFLTANGGAGGEFDSFDLPALAPGLAWAINPGNVTVFLSIVSAAGNPADFNHDGNVDGVDLAIWKGGFGSAGQPNNMTGDANGDGTVDSSDFLVWQQQLDIAPPASGVPEPGAMLLAVLAAFGLRCTRLR
jgi:hypothetical protein